MDRTDLLFTQPSFIGGLASILDLGATLSVYNDYSSSEETDFRALYSDWKITGNDIRSAMKSFEKSNL